jgi:DNA-binding transcriptional LysR family regulator
VADAGSLAAAALEEGVSPVVLGRRIDALERRLGVKLMYRSTRRLVVSEEGAAFSSCRGLPSEWDQAENELAAGRRAVSGHLIVSAPAAFGRKHVAPHAPGFLADKPDMQLSFNLTDRVVDLVREGYDLSIRIGGSVDPNSSR